jgi:hypothetical protein
MTLQPAEAEMLPEENAIRIRVPETSGRGWPPSLTATDRKSRPSSEADGEGLPPIAQPAISRTAAAGPKRSVFMPLYPVACRAGP